MIREDILTARYYQKNENGEATENWEGLARRVSSALAKPGEQDEFYRVVYERLFLPNTPALINAGKRDFSMSACFVLPVEDSMVGIFDAVKQAALVHQMGGGTGFDFSRLRPEGSMVKTTNGIASGPCSFIRVFDTATDVTKQGGTRRGANMGILRVDHPDIMKFITLKKKEGVLANFNLSIAVTDEFMEALERNGEYTLRFGGKEYGKLKAREVWDVIVEGAWQNGEPGVIFIDNMNDDNPTPHIGRIEATNPCGELPLLPYEACCLGSVNLSEMVEKNSIINWDKLTEVVKTGVRMLDNIIDVQAYPLPEVEKTHKANRKIGLGIMGWADMLIKLRIPYSSHEAVELAELVMSSITEKAVEESMRLAERDGAFPNWEGSVWQKRGIKLRNATLTTIAPTGSISIIAGCSSGIEPVYDWVTVQKRPVGEHKVMHPLYQEWVEKHGNGSLPAWFEKTGNISPERHVAMQATFQRYTHNAVSKTVNLPNNAIRDDIDRIFKLAYEDDCKGITVYRDGSRAEQVINSSAPSRKTDILNEEELRAIEESKRIRVKTSEGNVYVHITLRDEKPLEVFVTTPTESKYAEVYEAFARVFSVAIRHSVPVKLLLEQLEKANERFGSIVSPVYAVLKAFRLIGLNGEAKCPECKGVLVPQEGCLKCPACGYSKC